MRHRPHENWGVPFRGFLLKGSQDFFWVGRGGGALLVDRIVGGAALYVDRLWGIWGSYYHIPKAFFYLLKGDYLSHSLNS